MISVIDMPGPEESIWWRGKRGFEVTKKNYICTNIYNINFLTFDFFFTSHEKFHDSKDLKEMYIGFVQSVS